MRGPPRFLPSQVVSSWSSSSTGQKKGSGQRCRGRKGKGDQGGRREDILRLCRKIPQANEMRPFPL